MILQVIISNRLISSTTIDQSPVLEQTKVQCKYRPFSICSIDQSTASKQTKIQFCTLRENTYRTKKIIKFCQQTKIQLLNKPKFSFLIMQQQSRPKSSPLIDQCQVQPKVQYSNRPKYRTVIKEILSRPKSSSKIDQNPVLQFAVAVIPVLQQTKVQLFNLSVFQQTKVQFLNRPESSVDQSKATLIKRRTC